MKFKLLIILLIFIVLKSFSQDCDTIYRVYDKYPIYVDGYYEMYDFFRAEVNQQFDIGDSSEDGVLIGMTVSKEGYAYNIELLRSSFWHPNSEANTEALRLAKMLEKFTPGEKNGEKCCCYLIICIPITLKENIEIVDETDEIDYEYYDSIFSDENAKEVYIDELKNTENYTIKNSTDYFYSVDEKYSPKNLNIILNDFYKYSSVEKSEYTKSKILTLKIYINILLWKTAKQKVYEDLWNLRGLGQKSTIFFVLLGKKYKQEFIDNYCQSDTSTISDFCIPIIDAELKIYTETLNSGLKNKIDLSKSNFKSDECYNKSIENVTEIFNDSIYNYVKIKTIDSVYSAYYKEVNRRIKNYMTDWTVNKLGYNAIDRIKVEGLFPVALDSIGYAYVDDEIFKHFNFRYNSISRNILSDLSDEIVIQIIEYFYNEALFIYGNDNIEETFLIFYNKCQNTITVNIIDENTILITPNPSNEKFQISMQNITDKVVIEIYDITGNKVYLADESVINNSLNKEIDLSNLNSGNYIIKIFNSEKILANQNLIIQK